MLTLYPGSAAALQKWGSDKKAFACLRTEFFGLLSKTLFWCVKGMAVGPGAKLSSLRLSRLGLAHCRKN